MNFTDMLTRFPQVNDTELAEIKGGDDLPPVTVIGYPRDGGPGGGSDWGNPGDSSHILPPSVNPSPYPDYVTYTYTHTDCMHGGSTTNKVALYHITGGTNDVYGGYNSNIAIDNDGDPNMNTTIDPSYQRQTAYITGGAGTDHETYLDASQIAYVALSQAAMDKMNAHLGDIVVLSTNTGTNSPTMGNTVVYAIIGDVGNTGELGEMSYYAAQHLFPGDVTHTSTLDTDRVNMFVFSGSNSHNGVPITQADIDRMGENLLNQNPDLPIFQTPAGVSATCN